MYWRTSWLLAELIKIPCCRGEVIGMQPVLCGSKHRLCKSESRSEQALRLYCERSGSRMTLGMSTPNLEGELHHSLQFKLKEN